MFVVTCLLQDYHASLEYLKRLIAHLLSSMRESQFDATIAQNERSRTRLAADPKRKRVENAIFCNVLKIRENSRLSQGEIQPYHVLTYNK